MYTVSFQSLLPHALRTSFVPYTSLQVRCERYASISELPKIRCCGRRWISDLKPAAPGSANRKPLPYKPKYKKPKSIVDRPRSKGYAQVEAHISNGERLVDVLVCLDTGADVSCVDDRWVRVLRLPTEPTPTNTYHGISGKTASNECAKFIMAIEGKEIEVHATVLPAMSSGLLVGMNTLEKYGIDILNSTKVVRIGGLEVPLKNKSTTMDDYREVKNRHLSEKAQERHYVLLLLGLVVAVVMAVDFQGREATLTRRMHRGEILGKDDFFYILERVDEIEKRRWEDHVTEEQWQTARWEAYSLNEEVDVVLRERFGKPIVTSTLMRWKDQPDEATMVRLGKLLRAWWMSKNDIDSIRELERAKEKNNRRDLNWLWQDLTWRWRGRTSDAEQQ